MDILKVSSRSVPNSVAGAIAGVIREKGAVEIQAVGAGATNQAVKSIAIARGYLAPTGVDLVCIPAFGNVEIDGVEVAVVRRVVQRMSFCPPGGVRGGASVKGRKACMQSQGGGQCDGSHLENTGDFHKL